LPLEPERCRTDYEYFPDPATNEQFVQDQSSFDSFAKPDVIGEKERNPGRAKSLKKGNELEILNLNSPI